MTFVPQLELGRFLEGATPSTLNKSDVSKFKDADDSTGKPRVVAESQEFIIYSLKNRVSLRVLSKKSAQQLMFKAHTAPILGAKFLSYASNVVASYSEREICCWIISAEKGETAVHFRIDASPTSLGWVLKENNAHIVYLEGDAVKAVDATELMEKSAASGSEVPVANSSIKVVVGQVSASFLATGLKQFAVALDAQTVVRGSLSGTLTAPWCPTEKGEPIRFLVFAGPYLVAASSNAVFVWRDAEGATTPSLRISLAGLPPLVSVQQVIYASASASPVVEISFADATSVIVYLEETAVNYVKTDAALRANGYTITAGPSGLVILADFGSVLSYVYLTADVPKLKPRAPVGATANGGVSKSGGPQGRPAPQAAAPGAVGGFQPTSVQVAPPYAASSAALAYPVPGAQPLLRNPALLSVTAARTMQTSADSATQSVVMTRDELERALANLRQMLNLQGAMVAADHEKLLSRALEDQGGRLAKLAAGRAAPGFNADRGEYACTDADITFLMEKITSGVVVGVAPAIEEGVARQLEPVLAEALGKVAKKDLTADIRQRLDQVLQTAVADLAARVEDRIKAQTEQQLLGYIQQVSAEYNAVIAELQTVIQQQHELLAEYQRSNIVGQLEALRKDVTKLKQQLSAPSPAPAAAQPPSPETIVSTAQQFLAGKDYRKGLEWVVRYSNPELTIKLLTTINDETVSEGMLADPTVDDALWTQVLGQLILVTQQEQLDAVLWWVDSILVERETLRDNTQLRQAVQAFIKQWRQTQGLSSALNKLLHRLSVMLK